MRLALYFLCGALALSGATEVHSLGLIGARGGFQGSSVWIHVHMNWYDAYTGTVNTSNGQVTATGSNFDSSTDGTPATWDTVAFWPAAGGTVPGGINQHMPYRVCDKAAADVFQVALDVAGSCALVSWGSDAGSGTWKVGKGYSVPPAGNADHVYLTGMALPTGVTVGQCILGQSNVQSCATDTGEYWSYQGQQQIWLRLDISPTATIGNHTFSVTLHCRTANVSGCNDIPLSIPFKVEALTPLANTPPASYPAIANKATWESLLAARAAQWCPDKANGTINWAPLASFSFGTTGEQQSWFYDGERFYFWYAKYTGDPQWNNCGFTISRAYTQHLISINGDFSGFHRALFVGPYYGTQGYDMRGRMMNRVTFNDLGSGTQGSISEINMRENAFAFSMAMMEARYKGYERYDYIPAGTLKDRIKRFADMLMGHLWIVSSTDADEWNYVQSFHMGIGMKFAIEWYSYSSDERVPILIKRVVDLMRSTMTNNDPTGYPGEVSWMRGTRFNAAVDGGPKCAYNCSPYPALDLHGMFIPAYAFLYKRLGTAAYQTEGDALFTRTYTTYTGSNSGKLTNELLGWWSADYVDYREGRIPRIP